jgi:uncharacterized protein YjiK
MNLPVLLLLLLTVACGGGGGSPRTPEPDDRRLAVTVTGSGTVTSSPAGINCGSDCSAEYTDNTVVILTATPDTGFTFAGWDGACSGSGSCELRMSSNRAVTAEFTENGATGEFTLDVTLNGSGRVTSSPSGIDCEGDCSEVLQENSQIELTATPDQGLVLDFWSGDCSGNQRCALRMDSNKSVTANFAEPGQTTTLIENYSAPNDAFVLGDIPNNASGITWHPVLEQYLIVRNGSAAIYRYSEDFQFLGIISVGGVSNDTEGLSYVAGNEVMMVSEDNMASKLEIDEFVTSINGDVPNSQRYRLLPLTVSNKGLEGVAVRVGDANTLNRVYAVQEGTGTNSDADMRLVYFDMPSPDPMVLLSYDDNLTVVEPFNAQQAFSSIVSDLAGMVYDERSGHLIIVSQEARKAIQVNPDTGAVISELDITGANQFEGVTLGPNNELVFVSEPNSIRIYTQN